MINPIPSFLRNRFRKLEHDVKLRIKNLKRTPSLRTPDIRSREYIWQEIFSQRIYAHPHLAIEEEPINVVFDVGANIGLFSAWAAQEYAPKAIYAYEASPVTYKYLRKNMRKLQRMYSDVSFVPINAAVSDAEGERTIYHRRSKISASTLLEKGSELGGTPITVPSTSLSREIRTLDIGAVDLLKIDVEGHYMEVLEGISDFRNIRRIVMECDWVPRGAAPHDVVVEYLEKRGYSVAVDDPTKENNVTVYARQTRPLSTVQS